MRKSSILLFIAIIIFILLRSNANAAPIKVADLNGSNSQFSSVLDNNGNYYVSFVKLYNNKSHVFVRKSVDGGATWLYFNSNNVFSNTGTETPISSNLGAYDQYYPYLSVDNNNDIHLVWYGYSSTSTSNALIFYTKFISSANAWLQTYTFANSNILYSGSYYTPSNFTPKIVIDRAGNINIIWIASLYISGNYNQPMYIKNAVSSNGGLSWQIKPNIRDFYADGFLSYGTEIDKNDFIHIVFSYYYRYSPYQNQVPMMDYTNYNPSAGAWSTPQRIELGHTEITNSGSISGINVELDDKRNIYVSYVLNSTYSNKAAYMKYLQSMGAWLNPVNLPTYDIKVVGEAIKANSDNDTLFAWTEQYKSKYDSSSGSTIYYFKLRISSDFTETATDIPSFFGAVDFNQSSPFFDEKANILLWNETYGSSSALVFYKLPPAKPIIVPDTTDPASSVLITIDYPLDAVTKEYKIGTTGTYTTYASPIRVGSNTTIFARTRDVQGNWSSEASYNITNIQSSGAPADPQFVLSPSGPTNGNVQVTINYSANSTIKQYRIGSGTYQNYSAPISVSQNNTTIYAKSQDINGNWSNETSYTINNIDNDVPSGSIKINVVNGAEREYANTSPLKLALAATDPTSNISKMFISTSSTYPANNAPGWEIYSSAKDWAYTGSDGNVTLYAWFMDQAGNISSRVSDSIIFDATAPLGTISIENGSTSTSSAFVSLYFTKNYTNANVNKIIISNNSDFSNSLTLDYADVIDNWQFSSLSSGTKTVYAKYVDWAGNTSDVFRDDIIYSGGASSSPGNSASYITSVAHNQIVIIGEQTVVLSDPDTSTNGYTGDLNGWNVFIDNDTLKYRLEFDIPDASDIRDMKVEFQLNDFNADGIDLIVKDMKLKKLSGQDFLTIKDLNGIYTSLGRGRYTVALGTDNGGSPIIMANGAGKYAIEYMVNLKVRKNYYDPTETTVTIRNDSIFKLYIGSGYAPATEPDRPSHKTYIDTKVSRMNVRTL